MNELFKIEEVRAFDIVPELKDKFKKEMSERLGLNIKTFDSVREVVKGTDVICMVTNSVEPILMEEWVEPGCHVCATAIFSDTDPNCAVKFDKWVVGWYGRDLTWVDGEEKGKLGGRTPAIYNYTRKNVYADLATEIMPGKKPGRESEKERTIMTHAGMPALDVAAAALVYEKAKEKGIGTILKVF